jgi:hypothetical protein
MHCLLRCVFTACSLSIPSLIQQTWDYAEEKLYHVLPSDCIPLCKSHGNTLIFVLFSDGLESLDPHDEQCFSINCLFTAYSHLCPLSIRCLVHCWLHYLFTSNICFQLAWEYAEEIDFQYCPWILFLSASPMKSLRVVSFLGTVSTYSNHISFVHCLYTANICLELTRKHAQRKTVGVDIGLDSTL